MSDKVRVGHAGDSVSESIDIKATPQDVYDAVADVGRMPSWSPELQKVRVPYEGPLKFGDVFSGTNRKGVMRWSTTSKVTESESPKVFAIKVTGLGLPVASWRYEVEPTADGARLTITWIDDRAGAVGQSMRVMGFAASGVWNLSLIHI